MPPRARLSRKPQKGVKLRPMRDGLSKDADTLKDLSEFLTEIERLLDRLPANGTQILSHLAQRADGSDDQSATAVALNLSHDQIGRAVEKLRALGLLRRRENAADRRAQRLSITEKGRSEIGAVFQATQSLVKKFAASRLSE
jgi:DNA-binding MarR family transcriptional regulator